MVDPINPVEPVMTVKQDEIDGVGEAMQAALSSLTNGINKAITQSGGLEKKIQAMLDTDRTKRTAELSDIRREFAQTISSLDATCRQAITAVASLEARMVAYMGKLEVLASAVAKPMADVVKMLQETKLK